MSLYLYNNMSCAYQGAESEGGEPLPKKERIGNYDLEDDWIDDTDAIELIKASKKKSKLDGFFVIKVTSFNKEN